MVLLKFAFKTINIHLNHKLQDRLFEKKVSSGLFLYFLVVKNYLLIFIFLFLFFYLDFIETPRNLTQTNAYKA